MNTTFKQILDRVYVTLFKDYKLDNLKRIDEESFYTFLSGFLINSIDMFDGCLGDLSYSEVIIEKQLDNSDNLENEKNLEDEEIINDEQEENPTEVVEEIEQPNDEVEVEIEKYYEFNRELTSKEIYILALGVSIGWYKMQLDDVTQYALHLSSRNFKSYSEQANLAKRLERLNVMEENLSKEITNYQLANINQLPFFGGV